MQLKGKKKGDSMKSNDYGPLFPSIPRVLHGADYNPEQWLDYPEILTEDLRMMQLAKCNVMSVGIFAWSSLEPEEGQYDFAWLAKILDDLYANGQYVFLATPSGARPAWLAQRYPDVLRVNKDRTKNTFGLRHNHCLSSPAYRHKVAKINSELAKRFGHHKAVIGWHISNEYGGECHCERCQSAFRAWLQHNYQTLDRLNEAWWSTFWSHTYTNWQQIESPSTHGETMVHGMNLDWRRFVTEQTMEFMQAEIQAVRVDAPYLPVTTNFMEAFEGLDYWKMAPLLDFISWDSYPTWHEPRTEAKKASWVAMIHDMSRSMKQGKPFVLMESTPSATNWQPISKLKRPGMHLLSSLQAVAHGADSVQYFQWRKSRGSSEKFHGAVVDHVGHEHTRVFGDVREVGDALEKLSAVVGTTVDAKVALIFDWENRWAIQDAQGPRNAGIHYEQTVHAWYHALWQQGVAVDVIDQTQPLDAYSLLIAPMVYLLRPGFADKVSEFVKNGGVFVATYFSGIVDEHDLCYLGGFPGPLTDVLGIWSEEIDSLYDGEMNLLHVDPYAYHGMKKSYDVIELCDLFHTKTANVVATYSDDFYAHRPAVTVNHYHEGHAYYVGARTKQDFIDDFVGFLLQRHSVASHLNTRLPEAVSVSIRTNGREQFVFLMNFSQKTQSIMSEQLHGRELFTAMAIKGSIILKPFGVAVVQQS